MHAVDLVDAKARHQPVLDHGLAAGAALLGRLEDHHRGTGEIARLGQIARGAEQHGGVAVMAAGVHFAGARRFVRQPGFLLDRQRVHVGAQADHFVGLALAAVDDADHPGAAEAGHHLVAAEGFELLGDGRRRALHVIEQLRMGMQIVPPGGDFGREVGDSVDDRHNWAPWLPRSVANRRDRVRVQEMGEIRLLTGRNCAPTPTRGAWSRTARTGFRLRSCVWRRARSSVGRAPDF